MGLAVGRWMHCVTIRNNFVHFIKNFLSPHLCTWTFKTSFGSQASALFAPHQVLGFTPLITVLTTTRPPWSITAPPATTGDISMAKSDRISKSSTKTLRSWSWHYISKCLVLHHIAKVTNHSTTKLCVSIWETWNKEHLWGIAKPCRCKYWLHESHRTTAGWSFSNITKFLCFTSHAVIAQAISNT